jgi:hypothetical protein
MDATSSLADFPNPSATLAETQTNNFEEDNQSEAGDVYTYNSMCWDSTISIWSQEYSDDDANPLFDIHATKARCASRHAVKRSHTALARIQRTTKRRADQGQEPIGSRNDVWREALEKGAIATYARRRCRCEYCKQQAILVQERRTLRWAVRRVEQGKDWGRGRFTTNRQSRWPRWVDYDWDVEYEDGDAGESWDGAESVFGPGRVPPMEANLSELIRIPPPRFRRAAQSRRLQYSGLARRGTKGSSSVTETDPCVESSTPIPDSGPSRCDDDWELLSLCSEWDGCSVQSL